MKGKKTPINLWFCGGMRREIKKSIKNLILKGFPPLIPRICQEMEAGLAWKMRILEGKRAWSAGNSIGSADGRKRDNFPSFPPKIYPLGAEIPLGKSPREGFGLILFPFHGGRAGILGVYPKKNPFGIEGNPTLGQEKKREEKNQILKKK